MNLDRVISRRRFLQVAPGVGFSVLHLANGGKIVAQTPVALPELKEAPSLTELVNGGSLPAVAERVGAEPLVVEPTEAIGQYGGTWRTALVGGADTAWLGRTVGYEYLTRFSPQWDEIIPGAAKAYEVSEDSTQYTFVLRQGMKWSDGAPFGVSDIEFYVNDVYNHPDLGISSAFGDMTIEIVDDLTFTITFAEPSGLFLTLLASSAGEPWTQYPRHYLEQYHSTYNTETLDAMVAEEGVADWIELFRTKGSSIPGTPYSAVWQNAELPRIHPWVPVSAYGDNVQVTFQRNPYYWKIDTEGNQLPYIDSVNFEVVGNPEVLLLKAVNGELDMHSRHINLNPNKPVLAEAQESGGFHFFELRQAIMNSGCYMLNLTHQDPVMREIFQNKDFRIGLSHAIDRQQIIDVVYVGVGEPWQCAPRAETPFYNETLAKQYTEYNVDLANEYLDKVLPEKDGDGFRLRPDGERLNIIIDVSTGVYPDLIDSSTLVVEHWKAVGINAIQSVQDRALYNSRTETNQHDLAIWPGGSGLFDAFTRGYMYYPQNASSRYAVAWAYWLSEASNPLAEPVEPPEQVKEQYAIYEQIAATADRDEQIRLMNELLVIAQEQFYAIGINLPGNGYGIVKNNFKNVPESVPDATEYPTPAPTNPEQYYFES